MQRGDQTPMWETVRGNQDQTTRCPSDGMERVAGTVRQPGFQMTRWEAVEAIGCPRTTWEMVEVTRSSSNGMEGVRGQPGAKTTRWGGQGAQTMKRERLGRQMTSCEAVEATRAQTTR